METRYTQSGLPIITDIDLLLESQEITNPITAQQRLLNILASVQENPLHFRLGNTIALPSVLGFLEDDACPKDADERMILIYNLGFCHSYTVLHQQHVFFPRFTNEHLPIVTIDYIHNFLRDPSIPTLPINNDPHAHMNRDNKKLRGLAAIGASQSPKTLQEARDMGAPFEEAACDTYSAGFRDCYGFLRKQGALYREREEQIE